MIVEACSHCPKHSEQSKQSLERQAMQKKIQLREARKSNETKRNNSLGRTKYRITWTIAHWIVLQKDQCVPHNSMVSELQCAWLKVHKNNWNEKKAQLWKNFPGLVFINLVHSPSQLKRESRLPSECQAILLSPHQIHYCSLLLSQLVPAPFGPTLAVTELHSLWLLLRLMWCARDQTEKQHVQI